MKDLAKRIRDLRMNTSNLESPDADAWLDTKFFRSYRDVIEMSLHDNPTQYAAVIEADPRDMIEFKVNMRLEVPGFIAKSVLARILNAEALKAAEEVGSTVAKLTKDARAPKPAKRRAGSRRSPPSGRSPIS